MVQQIQLGVDQQTRSYFFSELIKEEIPWLSIVTSKVLNQSQRKKIILRRNEFNFEVFVLKNQIEE